MKRLLTLTCVLAVALSITACVSVPPQAFHQQQVVTEMHDTITGTDGVMHLLLAFRVSASEKFVVPVVFLVIGIAFEHAGQA